jgi:leucyl aminopeptidase
MTRPAAVSFEAFDPEAVASREGVLAAVLPADGTLPAAAKALDGPMQGALARAAGSEAWGKLEAGDAMTLDYPVGLAATAVALVKLDADAPRRTALAAGAKLAAGRGKRALSLLAGDHPAAADLALGAALRGYDYADLKTGDAPEPAAAVTVLCDHPDAVAARDDGAAAQAEGVFLTRDLVNAPANVLTTTAFAERLEALRELGCEVEVLEEDALAKLGMRCLLAVGQGSVSPSKVVVVQWKGGGDAAPLALIGKGVVFDTGGISLKPAAGMEEMTMDMGGAGTVAGAMHCIAMRKAKANVVGLVGLVENMPDGNAIRPGDVVASMKGDTVEIINTDAEGRLVLADVMWYAQDRFKPAAMIDLATLTGAIIIGLGNEKAGVFSNDDALAGAFLAAAEAEEEGAWRMPLAPAYDKLLKSRVADMKNVGGRPGGSITAAQFLQRFVKDGTPWIHLDIAGVASVSKGTDLAPAGATGWGVRALDRLVRDRYEAHAG